MEQRFLGGNICRKKYFQKFTSDSSQTTIKPLSLWLRTNSKDDQLVISSTVGVHTPRLHHGQRTSASPGLRSRTCIFNHLLQVTQMAESSLGKGNSRSGPSDLLVRKDKVFSERVSQMLSTKLSMVPGMWWKKKKERKKSTFVKSPDTGLWLEWMSALHSFRTQRLWELSFKFHCSQHYWTCSLPIWVRKNILNHFPKNFNLSNTF